MATEMARALLAHHPPQGIDDIRLAAAIGTHDSSDPLSELERCPLSKGLKADHFEAFKTHRLPLQRQKTRS